MPRTYVKKLPQNLFDGLKKTGMACLSFTDIGAVVGREYRVENPSNKKEEILVRCSQSCPYVLTQIDKHGGKYIV